MKRKTRKLTIPTEREEAAINRGIAADPDAHELSDEEFERMEPLRDIIRRRGRPKSATHKVPVTVRLEQRVVEFFRRGGRGWQTRLSDTLTGYVNRKERRQAQ